MSDATALLKVLERDPLNAIVRAMLVDELMDVNDYLRSEADQKIRRAVVSANDARNLALAAKLLAPRSDVLTLATWVVVTSAGCDQELPSCIYLLTGDAPPKRHPVARLVRGHSSRQCVSVGSDWLIDWVLSQPLAPIASNYLRRVCRHYIPSRLIP